MNPPRCGASPPALCNELGRTISEVTSGTMTPPHPLRPDHRQLVIVAAAANIARAPVPATSKMNDSQQPMRSTPNACQSCVHRKERCDKISPICSSCVKAKFECQYIAPLSPNGAQNGDGARPTLLMSGSARICWSDMSGYCWNMVFLTL